MSQQVATEVVKTYEEQKAEEERLNKKFGNMWNRSSVNTNPSLSSLCYCCLNPATQRIEANVWGTISQYDVCDGHAEYDGKNCDALLARKEKEMQDIVFTTDQVKALCGGQFPNSRGFAWERVGEFRLENDALQPYNGNEVLPGPALVVNIREDFTR